MMYERMGCGKTNEKESVVQRGNRIVSEVLLISESAVFPKQLKYGVEIHMFGRLI